MFWYLSFAGLLANSVKWSAIHTASESSSHSSQSVGRELRLPTEKRGIPFVSSSRRYAMWTEKKALRFMSLTGSQENNYTLLTIMLLILSINTILIFIAQIITALWFVPLVCRCAICRSVSRLETVICIGVQRFRYFPFQRWNLRPSGRRAWNPFHGKNVPILRLTFPDFPLGR